MQNMYEFMAHWYETSERKKTQLERLDVTCSCAQQRFSISATTATASASQYTCATRLVCRKGEASLRSILKACFVQVIALSIGHKVYQQIF